ncbi:MAG: bifunctional metallophosphatase/5'-nucleotidase [Ignavibacteriae bacterium]|nr:bifunctional metallophosphatase/5'-nucleotidase [Ignavibacteriota bacterium]
MKKYIIILFVLAFAFPAFAQESGNQDVKELIILHWNDFHSRNMPYKVNKKDSTGAQTQIYVGGTASMLGYLNKYRDDKSLVLNGGDDYQGTPISSITRGYSQIELLNLYNLDAFVLGNHDFDYGMYTLDSALKGANFPFLAANIAVKGTNKTFGKPYLVKEVNGIKIGIIGVVPKDLMTLTLPKNVGDLTMLNTDSVIAAGITILKKENCNLIVLLSHNGVDRDRDFAEKFHKDIDVIIGGHSHSVIFKPEIVNGVIICQAGSYGRDLGKLDLKVDITKDTVVKYFGKLYETKLDSNIFDKPAMEKVEGMISAIEPEMKKPIGKLLSDWKKSSLGQWEADAIRDKLQTDISFLNGGSIRKTMIAGDITVGDIWEINPFGNSMMKFSVSGKSIRKMLAYNLRSLSKIKDNPEYDNILVSGLYVELNSKEITEDSGDFIKKILVNGNPLDENKQYTVSSNNYVVSQMKKYFGEIPDKIEAEDTNILDRDLIIEAVQKQKEINSVFEKRIVDLSAE